MPTNTFGTLNADGRSYLHGTLTGAGTLYFDPPFVRVELDGDWSAFTGQINASGSDFRVNNTYGLAKAALYLNGDAAYSLNGSMTVGEISGSASATLTTTAWTVGTRNTTAIFAGIIIGNSVTKVGTGTWILTGNNTYTGTTTISGGAMQIGAGGNSGTLGTGNVLDNASLVFNRYDSVACSNIIVGSGSLTQAGDGVLTLSGVNTYSGVTFITAGTLALINSGSIANSTNINLANNALFDVSGRAGATLTLLNGQTLSGDGSVNGSITVASGAMLAPGNNDFGSLSFSNSLTLNAGSTTLLNVSHDSQTDNVVNVSGAMTYGGTLVISNADDPLLAGDCFKLFNAASYSGSFAAINPASPGIGITWDTSQLAVNGIIRVLSTLGDKYKADNNLPLNLAGSWTNLAVPGGSDFAVWDSPVSVINTTNDPGGDAIWVASKSSTPVVR